MFRRFHKHLRLHQEFGQYSGSGCIFNDVIIKRCALSAMDMEPQTLDEAM